jgi:uncharacterized membrane protein YcaP (DUF421 family)
MVASWLGTSMESVLMVTVSAVGIYLALLLYTRVVGLRSFAKISSFDFAVTVAIGSVMASAILSDDPPLLQAVVALGALYLLQLAVAVLRGRSAAVRAAVDNAPILLMAGEEVLWGNLRRARMTEADLRGKLREANVLDLSEIRAVVMESTGDVSVLHGDPEGPALAREIVREVRDADRLFTGSTP